MRRLEPTAVAGPFGTYAHGNVVEAGSRLVFGAGQVGVTPDGRTGEGIEEQARLVWENVRAVLAEARMEISNIAHLTMLLVDRSHQPAAMAVREEFLGAHRPASTLMYVAGLAKPEWLIEIDFIAAD